MSTTATQTPRIVEQSPAQPSEFRVRKGDLVITEEILDKGDEWKGHPGKVVIEDVRVLNAESLNGNRYTGTALADVAKHHQRRPVGIEHEDTTGQQRLWQDRLGMLTNGRVKGDGVSADWEFDLDGHPLAAKAVTEAVRYPELLMFSIEIDAGKWDGEVVEEGWNRVDNVLEMLDTALVSRGGTTTRINESRQRRKPMSARAIETVDQLKSRYPSLMEQHLIKECPCMGDKGAPTFDELTETNKTLQTKVDELTAELATIKTELAEQERKDAVRKALDEANVEADEAVVERYCKFSDEELKAEIADRKKLQEGKRKTGNPVGAPIPDVGDDRPWWESTN